MTLLDELLNVLAALNAQRIRAFLTLLGIILGVGTLVALSGVVAGSGKFMERRLQEAVGEDIISLSRSWGDWNDPDETSKAPPLNRFDSRALAAAPSLHGSPVLNRYSLRVPWGNRWGQNIWLVGTMPQASEFYGLTVAQGRFLTQSDVWAHTPVAILGASAAQKILPGETNPQGKQIKLKGQRFRVIGVLQPKPAISKGEMRTWDGSVIISETAFRDRFAPGKDLREIVVKAPPVVLQQLGLERLVHAAKAIVLQRHHGMENFRITNPAEQRQSRNVVALIVGSLELAISGVCLLVGGINLMNIMLVTVLQRMREIGIRRALGATRGNIRRLFLTEAAILALIGGVAGVAGGSAISWLLSVILTALFGYWPFIWELWPAASGLGSALLVGVLFGWYPAERAARLSPIECLHP
ncbi:MAG: ABC transporter permease [Cyanobacteria bacterium NC_groundwater_1444_Ag_S-0.65um_54_12]|nr:ABC transporter permease [Cyanobacteria bacterium NC_groundwater_1444_Ag_S-0.65um_54_12]